MSFIISIFHGIDMVVWVFKAKLFHFQFMTINCIFGGFWALGINILVEVLLSWPIFMIVLKYMFSCLLILDENGPLKGDVSNLPPCCINNYITTLLLSPNTWQSSFRYVIEDCFDLWKYMDWYCWPLFFCTCWYWFGPF